ncbi:MAG: hypothetical protein PHX74_06865 [Candidatus Sumerlaeales bacterium]|nr:hypothetical protein [Candidatus Sumerlaeales bacterium]
MATVKSLEVLKQTLSLLIDSALGTDVLDAVAEKGSEVGRIVVYGAYSYPTAYERRGGSGGSLLNPENFVASHLGDGELHVKNIAPANERYPSASNVYDLALLVEEGDGAGMQRYTYKPSKDASGDFREPRPFMAETASELSKTKEHIKAMKRALKSYGLKVK